MHEQAAGLPGGTGPERPGAALSPAGLPGHAGAAGGRWCWARWPVPTRRRLQVALGMIWLLDAALQYQPYMFTAKFVHQVIGPAIAGNPAWIAASQTWAAGLMVQHIALCNALFATIQLLIAAAILWPGTSKAGLAASIIWAIAVWWFGEGLGGIFAGASPLAGVPGAVVLYALIAVLVWPRDSDQPAVSVATCGPAGRHLPRAAWLVLWGSFAYFLLLPANRGAGSLQGTFAGMASGEPGWLAGFDRDAASALAGDGAEVAIILAVCCALVAVSVFIPALTGPGIVLAVLLALFFWLAQDFGGIFTGTGTDPNSGLLLVLLALTFWPSARPVRDDLPAAPAVSPQLLPTGIGAAAQAHGGHTAPGLRDSGGTS